jgi:hypothetical protein
MNRRHGRIIVLEKRQGHVRNARLSARGIDKVEPQKLREHCHIAITTKSL